MAASASSTVFFLEDKNLGHRFLVDTGAARSLFPHTLCKKRKPAAETMRAANNTRIKTYGNINIDLTLDDKAFPWTFTVADVFLPILGADFIAHYNLLVDVRRQRLYKNNQVPDTLVFHASSPDIQDLTAEFPAVFRSELSQDPKLPAKHNVTHHIKTSGPPIFNKFRRLSPEKLQAAKSCFRDLELQGICQKSSSPWSSPLHMVTKKDGSFRPCGDYRRLNNVTEPDHYPLPNIQDITSFLSGARIFSKLDLTKGYYQVPLNPADIPKTAITTLFGTYTFNYSCFGLRNVGATFQHLMDDIFGDLDFIVVYIDDILVFS